MLYIDEVFMQKPTFQNDKNHRMTVSLPRELFDEVKKNTNNISQFFHDAVKEKIKKVKRLELLNFLYEFKSITIDEETLEILRRDRNEE